MPSKKLPQIPKQLAKQTIKRKKLLPKEENNTRKKNTIEEEKQIESKDKIRNTMFGVNRSWERKKLELFELTNEISFADYRFNTNLPKLLIPKVIELKPHEASIRLEIVKSLIPFNLITTNYIITYRGVVGSLRRQNNELNKEAIIGKEALDEKGCISNDILLNDRDSAISRVHCKLIYTHWFKQKGISLDFLCFLIMNHRRINHLPNHVLRNIMEFLRERKKLTMSDMGSIYGTFLKIKKESSMELKPKMSFLISPCLGIEILEIYDEFNDFLLNYQNRGTLYKLFTNNVFNVRVYEDFIYEVFQNYVCNIDTTNLSLMFSCSHSPCLRIKLLKFNRNGTKGEDYLIIKRTNRLNNIFKINFGPTSKNNYKIDSFVSCEIAYLESTKKWMIQDVSNVFQIDEILLKRAEFGLWNSLSESKSGNPRYKPVEREVFSEDEIKVSETVFKIIC